MKIINFQNLQQLGRALMVPIAVLPIAGILLRLGQADLLNVPAIADAGQSVFANLPLLFAIGIALGFAKKNHGVAAFAAVVGFLIMNSVVATINPDVNTGVLGGIIIGIFAGGLYNTFHEIKLPSYLSFFGGKRFIAIITGVVAVILGFIFGYIWAYIQMGIDLFGEWMIGSGSVGLFLYGFFNRIMLMFGLHHVLNNLVWFQFGEFTNATGQVFIGDIARYMSGDPTAGRFMAGFFPIMMFGLPAACLAMYRHAKDNRKKAVAGLLLSIAFTAFLTGVTEPIEYGFMFLAPLLYIIHAVLTGISCVVMYLLDIHLGFTFSAGAIDYGLFFNLAQHPLLLIPVGLTTGGIYYFVFSFCIKVFNLKTIGREDDEDIVEIIEVDSESRSAQFIIALGGKANIENVDSCTTRLRLQVADSSAINQKHLKQLGAKGIVVPNDRNVQVILGLDADIVACEINDALPGFNDDLIVKIKKDISPIKTTTTSKTKLRVNIHALKNALGGKSNLKSVELKCTTRINLVLKKPNKADNDKILNTGIDACFDIDDKTKQLLALDNAQDIVELLQ